MRKITVTLLVMLGIVFIQTANAKTAKELFEQKCAICHITKRPTDKERKNLIAPPIFGVMRHVKQKYGSKDEAVKFIVDYVLNPSKEKSVCLKQTIDKFGVMPSQKGAVTENQLKEIASYMYDNFPPKGMKMPKEEPGLKNSNQNKTVNTSVPLKGEALVKKYGCLACHNVYGPKQAPGFMGVARRARMSDNPEQYIVNAIQNGSKGKYPKFKNLVMPPFSYIKEQDKKAIAQWILSLKRQGNMSGGGHQGGMTGQGKKRMKFQ